MDIQNHKTAGNSAGNYILIFSASNKKWEGEDWETQKIPESSRKTVLTWSPASKGDCECAKEERDRVAGEKVGSTPNTRATDFGGAIRWSTPSDFFFSPDVCLNLYYYKALPKWLRSLA
ncbi:hypothetical protein Pyn_04119 [Prunus yedoensis var. nudiflora]|uniref:Uncharacterized protein n=1 Tax=Prunus yedoensis var. nudiflora TaxID=2094558 RepID=A0A314YFA2_PRUYE|nr:hypothetical protein Pyn_04119 [Prunus yedoensis var. nudiflora]